MRCEIIKDLIPLIEGDVCSPQSKEAVLEHIKTCDSCRLLYESSNIQPVFVLSTDETTAQKSIEKSFRKVKRRWVASILLVIFFVPIFFLAWGQFDGRGLSFTNINEIIIANAFLRDLKQGDYEAAFQHLNLEPMKERWLKEWFEEDKLENIKNDAQRVFLESASLLIDAGGIEDFQFLAIDKQPKHFTLYYTIVVNGTEQNLELDVTDKGITSILGYGSFIDDPVAHFGAWSEYLWQEYEGCYFDPETKQYMY